ncbi:hypothetical protein EJV47_18960 [Hymenobacter gummosus]|uniref:Outer membrane protein beta-barrel domain-containing protein n=1 Tax=Hymenobacter gummosus TaxID=1776032 RepID=A0A431TZF3_9BACT|nr:hypothetical protein [Hymenobacter gummosus]RTQ47502.1 hypothetical protein EJV47_18960 [Hymenobacter gummosus]
MLKYLLALSALSLACSPAATAQRGARCVPYSALYTTMLLANGHYWHCSSPDTVERPFEPSRWGFFFGLAGAQTRHGYFGGAELEGTYRLSPAAQTGLVANVLVPQRIVSNLGVRDAAKPMLGLYTLSSRTRLFVLDNSRLRLSLLGGVGAGVATLADRAQQVADRGQEADCGCEPSTHAKTLATSVGLVAQAGSSLTYKLRSDLWLTANAYYQQWAGATRFGRQADLSPWMLSLGVTMPDHWKPAAR